jgi:hypothetical protein
MNIRTIVPGLALLVVAAHGLAAQEVPPAPGVTGQPVPGQPPPQPVIPEIKTGTPNSWFENTKLFMGEFLDKEHVTGKFKFKNPTGKPQVWRSLTGSCQCVRAVIKVGADTYELTKQPVPNSLHRVTEKDGVPVRDRVREIPIPSGAEGQIEVHMEMGGLQGLKEATLSITSSDEGMQMVTLLWQARGVKLFEVMPNDMFLNNMKWNDERKFKFVVQSYVKPDFQLLDHDALPAYVKVTSKKQIKQPDGKLAWEVEGTYGPNADPAAGGASLRFHTDWGKDVTFTIIATVTGPVTIEPGTFLSFGKIRKGDGAERTITFTPNDDFDLQLTKTEYPKLTIDRKFIETSAVKDGKKLVVTVKILPEVKGSFLVRGAVKLHLNHPAVGAKTFNFNGILR